MIDNEQRLCWLCKHFSFDGGSEGFSDLTPGAEAFMGCEKHKGKFSIYGMDQFDLKSALESAKTCELFEERSV